MIKLKGSHLPAALFLLFVFSACNRNKELFTELTSSQTNITFENKPLQKKAFGILYYLYYYNGGGVATGDINNDGLPDIYFTANSLGGNKLYLNQGNFKFEDITEKAGVKGNSDWCSGVTMADVNGDGYLDIYVSAVANHHGLKGQNQLFINNKNGTFTDMAPEYGLNFSGFTTQSAFFDYDHDGDLDCYVLNQSHKPNENIIDTSNRRVFDANAGDRLYRNDVSTTGKFINVSAPAGIYQSSLGYGLGLAISDLNNDGWEDIYVGNDFHENDYYYINNKNGGFKESGAEHFSHYSRFSMGNDIADYNNDGQLDIITVDMLPDNEKILKTYGSDENPDIYRYKLMNHGYQYQYSKNCLQRNNGNGVGFSETSLLSGVSATDWSWSPLFADFDNDGKKDLFISSGIVKRPVDLDYVRFISNLYNHRALNSSDKYDNQALEKMPDGTSHPFVFKGDGDIEFKDMSTEWGLANMKGYFTGAAYADLDNDGRLDIVINKINAPSVILKNAAPSKNHITIKFKGDGLNTDGIGAKAYLFQNGKMQYQQLMLTRGFQSSSEPRLHFGLPDTAAIDSLLIIWPDQRYQLINNVPVNQQLIAEQKNASGVFNYNSFFKSPDEIITSSSLNVPWTHKENAFDDYNVQYLIPHAESTRGPKLAVADINNDGLDDIYACGAKGQPGALMIQQKDGKFISSDTALFNKNVLSEEVDAAFFDVNNDGYKDLYVVVGGNEYPNGNPQLADRLYINNKGKFTKANTPGILLNKSCITYADIDNDGDQDIFIGTLADAKAYGVPQTSYLLINNGKGTYSQAPNNIIDLNKLGIVTSAVFTDVNNDKLPDLVIVGEWMNINVFINEKGEFKRMQLPASTGMWQTVFADDINKDGNVDLLIGNWGWNNKFYSGKNGPAKLYVSDFDKNGQTDQLLSYTLNGQEFPFLAKDEVERPLPTLKKHYLLYSDYAGVTMKDVFYGWIDTVTPLLCEKLGSVVCYGDGKGSFNLHELPAQLQLAPIFSFQKLNNDLYIAGGNFYDVIPYEGRYDAQPLALFRIKNDSISVIDQPQLNSLHQQFRDIKLVQTASGKKVIAAANNSSPIIFDLNNRIDKKLSDTALLELTQKQTFKYFWDYGHPVSGLARERSNKTFRYGDEVVTTGGSGFGIMAIIVAAERKWITKEEALNRLLKIARFLEKSDRFHGMFPHWLNGETGKTIPFSANDDGADIVETSFLFQGLLTAREYFKDNKELTTIINRLWHEADWTFFTRNKEVLYWHWSPKYEWKMNHEIRGWNECLITYIMAASSPSHSINANVYHNGWAKNSYFTNGKKYYGIELPLGMDYGGPLFFAHYSFLGLDPRGLKDRYADYWMQNKNHVLINRQYCIENPKKFKGYGENCWGLTASDNHRGYGAHAPGAEDLGVISPTAALSSFPYTPEYSMQALKYFYNYGGGSLFKQYGFADAFNESENWIANSHLAIDQGPIIVMIENYRSGLLWKLFMQNREILNGLRKLGFESPYLVHFH